MVELRSNVLGRARGELLSQVADSHGGVTKPHESLWSRHLTDSDVHESHAADCDFALGVPISTSSGCCEKRMIFVVVMHDVPRANRSERNMEESVKVSHRASGAYHFRNNFEQAQHVVAKEDLQLSMSACLATSSMSGRKRMHLHYLRQLCPTTGRNMGNVPSSNVFALTLESAEGAGKLLRGPASCLETPPPKLVYSTPEDFAHPIEDFKSLCSDDAVSDDRRGQLDP